jgi:hypothetical protein
MRSSSMRGVGSSMRQCCCMRGALGDTVQRVHETVQGTSRSFLVNLARMVAGFRATTGVVKAHTHREGGAVNGK